MAKATKKEDKSLKRLTIGVLITCILGVIGLFWYVASDGRPSRRSRRSAMEEGKFLAPLMMQSPTREMLMGGAPTRYTPGFGYQMMSPVRMPQGTPRYFANLSTTAGEYVVSVRQVADFDQGMTLYENALLREMRPPLSRISLSIQVMAASREAIQPIRDFASQLAVTDNKGGKQESLEASRMAEFIQGKARLIVLPPPTKEATYYTKVEGTIILRQEDGTEKQIPFTITNVPLPSQNHLFGLAAANLVTLSAEQSRFDAEGKGIIQGEPAYAFEEKFPPFTPETGLLKQPNRLILVPDLVNRFPLALPTPNGEISLLCTLTHHPEPESRNPMTIRLEALGNPAKPLEWKFEAYENEPIILTFAMGHFLPNFNQTAGIRLLVFTRPTVETLPTISPLRADPKTKSGSLVMTAKVGDRPLRYGKAKIEIVYRNGDKTQSGDAIVNLDEDGIGRIHNLPPGNYEVVLKELLPFHNNLTPQPDGLPAIMRRYHLNQPKLTAQIQKSLTLAPGGQMTLQPWRVVESDVVANKSPHSLP